MNDILNMNPASRTSQNKANMRLFGEEHQEEEPTEKDQTKEVEITSITKETAAAKVTRLDTFYKFMDNIEEETQSQLDQSESRRESTRIPENIMPSPSKKDNPAPRKADNKTSAVVDDVMQKLSKQLAVESGDTIATNDKYAIR